jgi:hypothetical protein
MLPVSFMLRREAPANCTLEHACEEYRYEQLSFPNFFGRIGVPRTCVYYLFLLLSQYSIKHIVENLPDWTTYRSYGTLEQCDELQLTVFILDKRSIPYDGFCFAQRARTFANACVFRVQCASAMSQCDSDMIWFAQSCERANDLMSCCTCMCHDCMTVMAGFVQYTCTRCSAGSG